jgi:hypothetical protein
LDYGKLIADGPTTETLPIYYDTMKRMDITADTAISDKKRRRGSGVVRFSQIRVEDENERETFYFPMGATVRFVIRYNVFEDVNELYFVIYLRSGRDADGIASLTHLLSDKPLKAGTEGVAVVELPGHSLRPHEFPIFYWLGDSMMHAYDIVDDLTDPLVITTDKDFEELGFHPTVFAGYVTLESNLASNRLTPAHENGNGHHS